MFRLYFVICRHWPAWLFNLAARFAQVDYTELRVKHSTTQHDQARTYEGTSKVARPC